MGKRKPIRLDEGFTGDNLHGGEKEDGVQQQLDRATIPAAVGVACRGGRQGPRFFRGAMCHRYHSHLHLDAGSPAWVSGWLPASLEIRPTRPLQDSLRRPRLTACSCPAPGSNDIWLRVYGLGYRVGV